MQSTNPQNPENGVMPAWLRPSKTAIIVQMIFTAAMPMAFGIVVFCIIQSWDVEFQRKLEMIRRGEVKPETLSVIKINRDKGNTTGSIAFGKDKKIMVWRSEIRLEGMQIGDETTAYPFGDEYLIPRFDRGNFWIKWTFLAGGLLMAFVSCGSMVLRILRRSRQDEKSRAATETTAVPKAFSRPSMLFNHNPSDSELTCVLKCPGQLGGYKIVEGPGTFRVSPAKLPTIGIIVFTTLGASALTAWMFYMMRSENQPLNIIDVGFWIFITGIWLVIIPVCLVALVVINRRIAKTEDFLRVDTTKRTLELCRDARTYRAADIVAFTELTRWLRGAEGWGKTQLTGVLVRTANGGVELYPLADVKSRPPLADRLVSIFQVPIRRIELSRSESRALNDC
jgi:hypothetical protein